MSLDDKNREFSIKTHRQALIEKAVGAEFNLKYAEHITSQLGQILTPEVELVQKHRELWTIPIDVKAELPDLDHTTNDVVSKKWKETLQRYNDPNRFMTPTASQWDNPHTWLKFDANLWPFERGLWKCYTIYLDNIHLPLVIQKDFQNSSIMVKPELLSDEDMEKLVLALSLTSDTNEENAKKEIKGQFNMHKTNEALALNMFIQNPKSFMEFYKAENMVVFPDRLMSIEEGKEWNKMLGQVLDTNKRKRLIVGEKGFGSYQSYEALYSFGFENPILKTRYLDEKGESGGTFSLHFPVKISNAHGVIGSTICSISRHPSIAEPAVSFSHGMNQLFSFQRWQSFGEDTGKFK